MRSVDLKERVEQILREHSGKRVKPAGGRAGHFEDYVVNRDEAGAVRVRSGGSVTMQESGDPATAWPLNPGLVACAEILSAAGLKTQQVHDRQGGYLKVAEGP